MDMKRKQVSLLLVAAFAITLSAFGWLFYQQRISNPAPVSIPNTLAGLNLMEQESGQQAAYNFIQLHGKQFPLTSGSVGIYGDHQATLWVAGTPLKATAAEMVISMRDKIIESRTPFTPTGEILSNGQTVYSLEGMGQKHYYFQSGNLIIWLAVDPDFSEAALQQITEYYR